MMVKQRSHVNLPKITNKKTDTPVFAPSTPVPPAENPVPYQDHILD